MDRLKTCIVLTRIIIKGLILQLSFWNMPRLLGKKVHNPIIEYIQKFSWLHFIDTELTADQLK